MDRDTSSSSTQPSDSNSVPLILTACAISFLLIFLVYSENFVFGSKAGHSIYPYLGWLPTIPRWIPITVVVLLGIAVFIGGKLIHAHEKIALLGCFVIAVLLQSIIHLVYPFPLGAIVQSDVADSFYTPAMRYSALEILQNYPVLASSYPGHVSSNMPGKILLFELFKPFTSSPEVVGYLVIVLSSLGALLLYEICKKLFHDKQIAFYAFLLYALIPCKLFFLPILNTVTPVFILLFFYLFLVYIEKKQMWVAWLLGVVLYSLILFEPSPLITAFILTGVLVYAIREKQFSIKDAGKLSIHLILAFLGIYIIFYVLLSFDLIQTFLYVLRDAVTFNLARRRDYAIWLGENIKDFFYDAGLPVMIILIYMTAQIFGQWKSLKEFIRWPLENIYLFSLWVTFLVVDLLGVNRGETTRLWIYLAVFFQVPASIFMARIKRGEILFFLVALTLVVQSMLTLHRVAFVIP